MIKNIRSVIQNSSRERALISLPPVKNKIAGVTAFTFLYIIISILAGPEDNKAFHFVDESGAVTALSAILFAAAGAFALVACYLNKDGIKQSRLFWKLSAAVLLFFALDELMSIHEAIGWLSSQSTESPSGFRNWNDVLVIGYGLAAACGCFYFLGEILRYPRFAELMAAAAGFYVLHTVVDSLIEPPTLVSGIMEESAKLFCAAFLTLSMWTGVMGLLAKEKNHA